MNCSWVTENDGECKQLVCDIDHSICVTNQQSGEQCVCKSGFSGVGDPLEECEGDYSPKYLYVSA